MSAGSKALDFNSARLAPWPESLRRARDFGTFQQRAKTTIVAALVGIAAISCSSRAHGGEDSPSKRLIARIYNSGFAQAHDTYNGMGTGSDGKIYRSEEHTSELQSH